MNRQELLQALKNHDWYHMMSDDGGVDSRGRARAMVPQGALRRLGGNFTWWDIHAAIQDQVVEDYVLDEHGTYYKQEWHDKGWSHYSHRRRDQLITALERDEILSWFDQQETA